MKPIATPVASGTPANSAARIAAFPTKISSCMQKSKKDQGSEKKQREQSVLTSQYAEMAINPESDQG